MFGPTLVNEVRLGFLRDFSSAQQDPFGLNQVDQFVPGVPENPAVAGGISQIKPPRSARVHGLFEGLIAGSAGASPAPPEMRAGRPRSQA